MGWNTVTHDGSELFMDSPQQTYFYFVHSYGVLEHEAAVAWSDYGGRFVAAVQAGPSSYAVQFHPEKSSRWGLRLLENFLRLAQEAYR
jgi:glutamine amidotransferase